MKWDIQQLRKSYGGRPALDGVDFCPGSDLRCMALIGPSGGGKSTLLRHLAALESPDSGEIWLDGKQLPTTEAAQRAFRQSNGFLFQSYNLFPHLTVRENIQLPLVKVHRRSPADAARESQRQLARFGMEDQAEKLPRQLSGGQQQRAALIRAIASQPKILFLDEPTAALDPEMTAEVLSLVQELLKEGQKVILCTHEMGFARAAADLVVFVAAGKLVASAPPQEFFANPPGPVVSRFLEKALAFG